MFADSEFKLTPAQDAALEAHLELLMRWNRTVNLTAIRNREEAVERHYGESLFLAASLPPGALRIADIGSGGGFPGFPVAVFRPECVVTLIESHQRKAVFLKEASRGMPNVRVLAKRAEDVAESVGQIGGQLGGQAVNQTGGQVFDWVISRAVSYEDLAGVVRRLAPNVALLTGIEVPPEGIGFVWETAVALPWGAQRFLRVGHKINQS